MLSTKLKISRALSLAPTDFVEVLCACDSVSCSSSFSQSERLISWLLP